MPRRPDDVWQELQREYRRSWAGMLPAALFQSAALELILAAGLILPAVCR
jgi:hypothetical protein